MKRFLSWFLNNHLFLILVVIFMALFYRSSSKLPADAVTYPNMVMLAMIVVIGWNIIGIINEYREYLKENPAPAKTARNGSSGGITVKIMNALRSAEWKNTRTRVYLYLCIVLFGVLMPFLGFILVSLLYLAGAAILLGARKKFGVIIYVIIVFGTMYGVFDLWLGVPFPKGLLFDGLFF